MGTPFDALIAANPTAGVLHLPPSTTYDPAVTYSTPDAQSGQTVTFGLFTRELAEGLAAVYDAQFTIPVGALSIANAKPETLKVTVDGINFSVAKVRRRYWKGVQAAWTLMLNS